MNPSERIELQTAFERATARGHIELLEQLNPENTEFLVESVSEALTDPERQVRDIINQASMITDIDIYLRAISILVSSQIMNHPFDRPVEIPLYQNRVLPLDTATAITREREATGHPSYAEGIVDDPGY